MKLCWQKRWRLQLSKINFSLTHIVSPFCPLSWIYSAWMYSIFLIPISFYPPLFWHCLFTSLISKDFIFFGFLLFLLQFPFYSFLYCQLDQAPSPRFHQFRVFGLFGHSGSVLTSRPTTPFGLFLNCWLVFLFGGSL